MMVFRIFVLILIFINFVYAEQTVSYKCIDRKDNYSMYFNIDYNSLHYVTERGIDVFNYTSSENKDSQIIHFFERGNTHYAVHQMVNNPIDTYIDEYENNKLKYEYKCKLSDVLDKSTNDRLPITWKKVPNAKKLLNKVHKKIDDYSCKLVSVSSFNANGDMLSSNKATRDIPVYVNVNDDILSLTQNGKKIIAKKTGTTSNSRGQEVVLYRINDNKAVELQWIQEAKILLQVAKILDNTKIQMVECK